MFHARRTTRIASVGWLAVCLTLLVSPVAKGDEITIPASLQATRFPTVEQLRCSDAGCGQGLLVEPMFTGMEYRDTHIIGGGAFALARGYRGKVSAFWSDVPTRQSVSGGVGLSINLAVFSSLRDAKDAVLADAVAEGTRLTKVSDAALVNRWFSEGTAPDGTRLRYAYVITADPDPTIIRGVCALWGSSRRSPSCSLIGLVTMVSDIALRAPSAPAPNLVPVISAGATAVLTATLQGSSAWAADSPGMALLATVADTTTTVAQYRMPGQPSLAATARVVALPAERDATAVTQYVAATCEPIMPGTTCRREQLPGGGTVQYLSLKGAPRKVVLMQVRTFSNQRLSVLECSRARDFTAMTAIQLRSCAALGAQLGSTP